jgi:hypothetical protein
MPDAMQYSPVCDGNSAWQLYHDQSTLVNNGRISFEMQEWDGFNTVYHYPYDRWIHVKLVVSGVRADIYFDHEENPTLQIRELRRRPSKGGVGLKTGVSPCYFADFSFTPMDQVMLKPLHSSVEMIDQFRIPSWDISTPVAEGLLDGMYVLDQKILDTLSWTSAASENTGVVNLSAVTVRPGPGNYSVLAKVVIHADADLTKKFDFGYSDRVRLYCNGQLLYSGDNGYLSRDYRFLGTIGYFDSVYLPLKTGRNEIILAVGETFGGWGVQARLENMDRMRLE